MTELSEIVDKKAEYMLSIYNEIQNIVFDLKWQSGAYMCPQIPANYVGGGHFKIKSPLLVLLVGEILQGSIWRVRLSEDGFTRLVS